MCLQWCSYFTGECLVLDRRAKSSLFMHFSFGYCMRCVFIFNRRALFYSGCTVGASLLIVLFCSILLTLFGMQNFNLNYIL